MTLYLPITVDLYNPYPLKVMNIPQYNTGRGALITLTAAGSVIVPDKEALYIYAKKPDGTMVYASCELSGTQVRATFDEQTTAVAGVLDVEIQIVDASGNSITTTIFQINIMASNIDYARIVSSDDFIALRNALAAVSGIGNPAQLATENKSSLVAAVNELHGELEQNASNIGDLTELQTTNKESLVAAVNEQNVNLGKIACPYPSLTDVMLFGFISKKQHNALGDTCYVVFIQSPQNQYHGYGMRTIKRMVIQGIKELILDDGVVADGVTITNVTQTYQGFFISFKTDDDFDYSGYLCDCIFDFY